MSTFVFHPFFFFVCVCVRPSFLAFRDGLVSRSDPMDAVFFFFFFFFVFLYE